MSTNQVPGSVLKLRRAATERMWVMCLAEALSDLGRETKGTASEDTRRMGTSGDQEDIR